MRTLRRGRRSETGLSLIELVVVIAIGGLLLALVFGGQSLIANRRLTGTARKVAADMRMIEQRARTERTCYRIVFDAAGNSYTIDRYAGAVAQAAPGGGSQCADGSWAGRVVGEQAGDSVSRRMPPAVHLVATSFARDTLVVSPFGNPNAGSVTLRTSGGETRVITIEPMGRVRIQ